MHESLNWSVFCCAAQTVPHGRLHRRLNSMLSGTVLRLWWRCFSIHLFCHHSWQTFLHTRQKFLLLSPSSLLCCVSTVEKRIFACCPFFHTDRRMQKNQSKKFFLNFSKSCRNRASHSVKYSRGSFISRECLKASVGSGLERDHSKSLLSTYSRLYMLFMQVRSVRLELYLERGGPG